MWAYFLLSPSKRSAIGTTRRLCRLIKCDQCNCYLKAHGLWPLTLAVPDSCTDLCQRLQFCLQLQLPSNRIHLLREKGSAKGKSEFFVGRVPLK